MLLQGLLGDQIHHAIITTAVLGITGKSVRPSLAVEAFCNCLPRFEAISCLMHQVLLTCNHTCCNIIIILIIFRFNGRPMYPPSAHLPLAALSIIAMQHGCSVQMTTFRSVLFGVKAGLDVGGRASIGASRSFDVIHSNFDFLENNPVPALKE